MCPPPNAAAAPLPTPPNPSRPLLPQVLTLPTLLTLGRVAAIPALIAAWFAQQWTACAVLFLAAALTDWLDGYLARKMVSLFIIFFWKAHVIIPRML